MTARFALIYFSAGVFLGVLFPVTAWPFWLAAGIFILSVFIFRRPVAIIGLSAGILLGVLSLAQIQHEAAGLPQKGFAHAVLTISSQPEFLPDGRFTVTSGLFRLYYSANILLYRGQQVEALGTVYPEPSPGARRAFYVKEVHEYRPGSPVTRWSAVLRVRMQELIVSRVPESTRALMLGMLTGNARFLDFASTETFRMTGLTHLLAVSGLNVAIVGAGVLLLLGLFLPARAAAAVSSLLVLAYTAACGFEPSVLRAGLMFTVFSVSRAFGRPVSLLDAMVWAAAFTLALNPLDILGLGFWLSYLAVAGLVFLSPLIAESLAFLPGILKDSLSVTLSANLATLPILLYFFQSVSLISPLANLIVLPLFNILTLGLFLEFGLTACGIMFPASLINGLNGLLWDLCRYFAEMLSLVPGGYRIMEGLPRLLMPILAAVLPVIILALPRFRYRFHLKKWNGRMKHVSDERAA